MRKSSMDTIDRTALAQALEAQEPLAKFAAYLRRTSYDRAVICLHDDGTLDRVVTLAGDAWDGWSQRHLEIRADSLRDADFGWSHLSALDRAIDDLEERERFEEDETA